MRSFHILILCMQTGIFVLFVTYSYHCILNFTFFYSVYAFRSYLMPASYLGDPSFKSEVLYGFPQFSQANARIVLQIRPNYLPFTCIGGMM
jgi:hypothetical protein